MGKRIKIYKMPISEYFPKTHKRADAPTDFCKQIFNAVYEDIAISTYGMKRHTIRQNYYSWKRKINEVIAGDAILVLFAWSGMPYRSKQVNHFVFGKQTAEIEAFCYEKFEGEIISFVFQQEVEIGVQRLNFQNGRFNEQYVDDMYCYTELDKVAENDGLTYEDWREWFRDVSFDEPLAIIHFTKFRY